MIVQLPKSAAPIDPVQASRYCRGFGAAEGKWQLHAFYRFIREVPVWTYED